MVLGFLGGFDQFLDDMRRGGLIRIAHPEVDDILASLTCLKLEALHLGKYVWRKALDAVKTVANLHGCVRLLLAGPLLNGLRRHSERGVF